MKNIQTQHNTLKSIASPTSMWVESRYKTKTGGEQVIKFPMTDEPNRLFSKFQKR